MRHRPHGHASRVVGPAEDDRPLRAFFIFLQDGCELSLIGLECRRQHQSPFPPITKSEFMSERK